MSLHWKDTDGQKTEAFAEASVENRCRSAGAHLTFQGGVDRDFHYGVLGSTSRSILPVAKSLPCHDLCHEPGYGDTVLWYRGPWYSLVKVMCCDGFGFGLPNANKSM